MRKFSLRYLDQSQLEWFYTADHHRVFVVFLQESFTDRIKESADACIAARFSSPDVALKHNVFQSRHGFHELLVLAAAFPQQGGVIERLTAASPAGFLGPA